MKLEMLDNLSADFGENSGCSSKLSSICLFWFGLLTHTRISYLYILF